MPFEGGEEQVAQSRFDTHPIGRPCSQGTPDFLHTTASQDQDAAGEPTAQLLVVLSPWSGQSLIDDCQQLGGQSALEPDRRFGSVTQVVVIRGE
jgi:hypothetical protein